MADGVRERANALLFNGRFYTHFHKLVPVTIAGVDEAEQLSLSNPMAINRGLATREIAVAVIGEYRRRGETTGAFAPWFSIDPPFPAGTFGDDKIVPGAYVNGGIMPLVGGELARAAFEHGFESYGVEILEQYRDLVEATGETYLWYFPDGTPSTVETSTSPKPKAYSPHRIARPVASLTDQTTPPSGCQSRNITISARLEKSTYVERSSTFGTTRVQRSLNQRRAMTLC